MRAIVRTTPRSEKCRLVHIVQTAKFGRHNEADEATEWGRKATADVARFKKEVLAVLEKAYGPGIGGLLSYQDLGEEAFKKPHPHVDLTLNAWKITPEGPRKAPPYERRAGGAEKWRGWIKQAASRMGVPDGEGNLNIGRVAVGVPAYAKTQRYQVREVLDLRKLEYDPSKGLVYWHDYKNNRRTKFTPHEFLAGVGEYRWRLRQWPDEGKGRPPTTSHGIMADRSIKKTQATMHAEDPMEKREKWARWGA